ncbi:hypothetical protein FQA47_003561 [Oryzias melastigma]|uniref:Uncharacterized protein n=1 Tax=Oryzias melastigma TaxID=30732 RepID=A0A834F7W0_ORYME|nr:hypothetical protein FQA47_003561 [Oryzias melastigma]
MLFEPTQRGSPLLHSHTDTVYRSSTPPHFSSSEPGKDSFLFMLVCLFVWGGAFMQTHQDATSVFSLQERLKLDSVCAGAQLLISIFKMILRGSRSGSGFVLEDKGSLAHQMK